MNENKYLPEFDECIDVELVKHRWFESILLSEEIDNRKAEIESLLTKELRTLCSRKLKVIINVVHIGYETYSYPEYITIWIHFNDVEKTVSNWDYKVDTGIKHIKTSGCNFLSRNNTDLIEKISKDMIPKVSDNIQQKLNELISAHINRSKLDSLNDRDINTFLKKN